jgi:hypothetical protein
MHLFITGEQKNYVKKVKKKKAWACARASNPLLAFFNECITWGISHASWSFC